MSVVMVGGSRSVHDVPKMLAARLSIIVERGMRVLIGDAPGFDRAVQAWLSQRGYRAVEVFCTRGEWRNNVGSWPIRAVDFEGRSRGRAFYTAKDDAMVSEADYGLFAWDGTSAGTLRNVRVLAERGRPSLVLVTRRGILATVRNVADMEGLERHDAQAPGDLGLFADEAEAS